MPVSAASLCSLAASIPSRGPALPASVSALAASLQPKPLGGSLRGRFVSLEGWADGDELARARGVWAVTCGSAVSGAAACPPFDAEALCWRVGEIVELRGRTAPTQLARPVNLVVPNDLTHEGPVWQVRP